MRTARTRTPDNDLGVLGRASDDTANTFGSLSAVGKIGGKQSKMPSLKSFDIGNDFIGSGSGGKWENTRTAVIGHHAGDPKIIQSVNDVRNKAAATHEKYYYDEHHDDNGRALTGGNTNAPDWWEKGKDHERRPYVVWGSRYVGESSADEHKDDSDLVKAGVNVEGRRNSYRAVPFPWLDNTEWDHDKQQGRDPPKSPYQFQVRDEASSKVLREHGVMVNRDPFVSERDQGTQDKVVTRRPCTYRYVDGVAGMQTHTPYFTDPNYHKSGKASRYRLEKAGVLLSADLLDRAIPAPHLASYDPTREDGCDQGDSDHIVDFGTSHKLPEGQLDVEMEPPHGSSGPFVNVFSPDYHGPGAKHLTTEGDAHFR